MHMRCIVNAPGHVPRNALPHPFPHLAQAAFLLGLYPAIMINHVAKITSVLEHMDLNLKTCVPLGNKPALARIVPILAR